MSVRRPRDVRTRSGRCRLVTRRDRARGEALALPQGISKAILEGRRVVVQLLELLQSSRWTWDFCRLSENTFEQRTPKEPTTEAKPVLLAPPDQIRNHRRQKEEANPGANPGAEGVVQVAAPDAFSKPPDCTQQDPSEQGRNIDARAIRSARLGRGDIGCLRNRVRNRHRSSGHRILSRFIGIVNQDITDMVTQQIKKTMNMRGRVS
jgi:hypothetical protein